MTSTTSAERQTAGGEGDRAFLAVAAVAFVASAAATVGLSLNDVPICRGGGGSLATWRPGTAAAFLGMWLAMMTAMMLPSLVPMLRRYRRAIDGTGVPLERLTAWAAAGYFCVQTGLGLIVFALGAAIVALPMEAVLVTAGAFQLSPWKGRALRCCRAMPPRDLAADAETAWRHGLHLGLHCTTSSAGLMAVLLAVGMMNLWAMTAVAVAISLERLAPAGERIARAIGGALLVAGLLCVGA